MPSKRRRLTSVPHSTARTNKIRHTQSATVASPTRPLLFSRVTPTTTRATHSSTYLLKRSELFPEQSQLHAPPRRHVLPDLRPPRRPFFGRCCGCSPPSRPQPWLLPCVAAGCCRITTPPPLLPLPPRPLPPPTPGVFEVVVKAAAAVVRSGRRLYRQSNGFGRLDAQPVQSHLCHA